MLAQQLKEVRIFTHTPMRFQARDGAILQAIYEYDGVLARRHLKDMFWPTFSKQAMERRLSLLYHNGYLNWPSNTQRRTKPIPEPIVWLGWRGVKYVSGQAGVTVKHPSNPGERQLRLFDRRLLEQGIHWQREPRWSQLFHDLAVVDFRLTVEAAISRLPSFHIETWIPEGAFLSQTDVVDFTYAGINGKTRKGRKGVRPDGYFILVDRLRETKGSPARARFLLELDNATHPQERFGRDKVAAGLAYIRSQAYKTRFGYNSGRWLVVCPGERRMYNMKRQAEFVVDRGATAFYFSTFDQIKPETVLTDPIWYRGGCDNPQPLLQAHGKEKWQMPR